MKNEWLNNITKVLVILGGITWGLIGALQFDLIGFLFNTDPEVMSPLTRVIYVLIGLSAIYQIVVWVQLEKKGKKKH